MLTRARARAPCEEVAFFPHGIAAFLMYGIVPSYASTDWEDCGTLGNGKLVIRASSVEGALEFSDGGVTPGRGLFANTDFRAGCIISVYGGQPIYIKEAVKRKATISQLYMLRLSDTDFVIDGWQFASGIQSTASPSGVFDPIQENGPQFHQGAGAIANHASGSSANAKLAFVALGKLGDLSVFPRVPVLRAIRNVRRGDEILFNYGSDSWRLVM